MIKVIERFYSTREHGCGYSSILIGVCLLPSNIIINWLLNFSVQILDKIGEVAYKLDLPMDSKIHNVFHVFLLKPFKGPSVAPPLLPLLVDGRVVPTPARVLKFRLNHGSWEILVVWAGCSNINATWELRTSYFPKTGMML